MVLTQTFHKVQSMETSWYFFEFKEISGEYLLNFDVILSHFHESRDTLHRIGLLSDGKEIEEFILNRRKWSS